MSKTKKTANRQRIESLMPEKIPAERYGILWWLALYTALTVGAELTLDAVWSTRQAHLPAVMAMALLLVCSGFALQFHPGRRQWMLRLLPWAALAVSFLLGNPLAGGADWLNCFLRQWNVSHDTLYRELAVSATGWDQTAFLLLSLVLLSRLTFFLLQRRRLWLGCVYVGAFAALGFLAQTGRMAWFPLLMAGLLGYFLSGPSVRTSGRGALVWAAAGTVLLLGLLLPTGEMDGIVRLRSNADKQIHDLRYGAERLPLGNLYAARKLSGGSEAELEIHSEQSKDLYLRAYIGSSYASGSWSSLPETAYGGENTGMFSWLEKQGFRPQTQLSQYAALGTGTAQSNQVQLRVDGASREWYYAPNSLETLRRNQVTAEKDRALLARGLFGRKSYTYEELSGSRPGELTVPESWVTKPRTEAQESYLRSEAVYRDFVYENYTAVDSGLSGLMNVLFHETEPESDSTFSVLTHVREVLRSRCRYDGGAAESPAEADPIADFLLRSRRGNAALFASAAVEALRSYGIPARYAEGYRCPEARLAASADGWVTLTGQDRHAWVEIYFDGIGWIGVDVTPGCYYDLVSLQKLVSLPEDVTKTADLTKNDALADEDKGDSAAAQNASGEPDTVAFPVERLLCVLAALVLLAAGGLLLAELLRAGLILFLSGKLRKDSPLKRAKREEKLLFAVLAAKGIRGGLGWNTEQMDARIAATFPKIQPGEYARVCGLLEKAVYGEIPPEIYEERTIVTLLRRLCGVRTGSGLRERLRGRYGWMTGALR